MSTDKIDIPENTKDMLDDMTIKNANICVKCEQVVETNKGGFCFYLCGESVVLPF